VLKNRLLQAKKALEIEKRNKINSVLKTSILVCRKQQTGIQSSIMNRKKMN